MGCHLRPSCATWLEELAACSGCCHGIGLPDRFKPKIAEERPAAGICRQCGDAADAGGLCEDCRLDERLREIFRAE